MSLQIFATFSAPLITIIIGFWLNKYFQNKPKLIAYYGAISSHKIQTFTGYAINIIELTENLDKSQLDISLRDKIPLLIKNQKNVSIYGLDDFGNTKLTPLAAELFKDVPFYDNLKAFKKYLKCDIRRD